MRLERIDGIAYREAMASGWEAGGPVALALHGYPESSYLWRKLLPRLADLGYRAVAPDLPGFGDSPADRPGTWERQVEHVERFRRALDLDRVALVVHDWGGLIGLRWACDHPATIAGLVISNTGFFPDGRWHGLAQVMRTEGQGEEFVANMNCDLFAQFLRQASAGIADDAIDEYWKAFADEARRQSQLDLYRSGDFSKLEAYEGRLAALDVPTLVLWGARDPFAPVGGAYRFRDEIPGSKLVILDDAGHFLMEDEPARAADEISGFLAGVAAGGRADRAPLRR